MHEQALTDKAAALFPSFRRFNDFYLAGGTALALQIGHRRSVDFDFFSEKAFPAGILAKTKRVFSGRPLRVTYQAPEQLNLVIDGVHVTFFAYPYPLVDAFVPWQSIPLASVLEIALMKAFSIGKRLSYKDYVDWYFLLKENHVALPEVLSRAKRKFGNDFNDRLFLGQLVSLEDVPDQKIDFLRNAVRRATVETTLRKTVKELKL